MTPEKFKELFPIMSENYNSLRWMTEAYDLGDFTHVHFYTGLPSQLDDDEEVSPLVTRMIMSTGEFGCHPRATVDSFLETVQKQYQKGKESYGDSLRFDTNFPTSYFREEVIDASAYALAEVKRNPEKVLRELELAVDLFDALCELARYEINTQRRMK